MFKALKPYLLELKSNFKVYELQYVLNMNSEYAIRIYEMLKQYEKIGSRIFIVKDLQEILHVPVSYKKKYIDFRIKVLDISVREINKHSDLIVSYTPVKMGRSVHSINFTIEKNRNNILEKKVEDNIFYSELLCEQVSTGTKIRIDSRTSDAISLAVRFKCKIYELYVL